MDFVLANWHLFVALVAVVVMLVWGPLVRRLYGVKTLSVPEAVRVMNHEHGVLVDVCEPNEFRGGHIPNAINAPLSSLGAHARDLDKYKARPVIVSCRSGNRSVRGAVLLRKAGFERVYSLAGGLVAWQGENLPVAKS
jgi:rhodanese-related sulfurtransferase